MLGWLFGKRKMAEPRMPYSLHESPQPGQLWLLTPEPDPFPKQDWLPVRILEVRDGWVRYYMGRLFPDERKKIKDFLRLYQRVHHEDYEGKL